MTNNNNRQSCDFALAPEQEATLSPESRRRHMVTHTLVIPLLGFPLLHGKGTFFPVLFLPMCMVPAMPIPQLQNVPRDHQHQDPHVRGFSTPREGEHWYLALSKIPFHSAWSVTQLASWWKAVQWHTKGLHLPHSPAQLPTKYIA